MTFGQLANLSEVHGGSPWAAGTFSVSINHALHQHIIINMMQGGDGSRMPSDLELEVATIQGEAFGNHIKKVSF